MRLIIDTKGNSKRGPQTFLLVTAVLEPVCCSPKYHCPWQEAFLVVTSGRGEIFCLHPVRKGQGRCQTSYSAQDRTAPHSKEWSGPKCQWCWGWDVCIICIIWLCMYHQEGTPTYWAFPKQWNQWKYNWTKDLTQCLKPIRCFIRYFWRKAKFSHRVLEFEGNLKIARIVVPRCQGK